MKKNLIFGLCLTVILAGCSTDTPTPIDSSTWNDETGLTIEQKFNQEISQSNYITDFSKIFNHDISEIEDNQSIISVFNVNGKFDEKSSLSGNIDFSKETSKFTKGFENSEISFDLDIASKDTDIEPIATSGSLSLLYRDKGLYAMLHDFSIYMGEGNMTAKMYNLFSDLLIDRRIDLEIGNEDSIITVSEDDNTISELINAIIEMVTAPDYESDDSIFAISKIINYLNDYAKLGISTEGLTLIENEITYGEFGDGSLSKTFSGHFISVNSDFLLGFTASKNGLEINIDNIQITDEENESALYISLQNGKKSQYTTAVQHILAGQEIGNLDIQINCDDKLTFQGTFILEPLELISGQKISGNLRGYLTQKISSDNVLPELSGNILLLQDIIEYL